MIETIPYVLTGIGIIISILYYTSVLNNANKTRELQLKAQEQAIETRQLQLYSSAFQPAQNRQFMLSYVNVVYNQKWTDYEDFMEKYGPETNPEAYTSVVQVLELFQMIGLFVEQKALGIEIVNKHTGTAIIRVWEKLEPFIKGFRVWTKNPGHWHSFEYLYIEMKKLYPKLYP